MKQVVEQYSEISLDLFKFIDYIDPEMNIYKSVHFEMTTRSAMAIIEKFCKQHQIDNEKDLNNTIEKMTFLKKEMFD